jgi:hypothetical protein
MGSSPIREFDTRPPEGEGDLEKPPCSGEETRSIVINTDV